MLKTDHQFSGRLVVLSLSWVSSNISKYQKYTDSLTLCFVLTAQWYFRFIKVILKPVVSVILYSLPKLPKGQHHSALAELSRCSNITRQRWIKLKKAPATASAFFLVGEGGFEPPKSLTTDLQSAPFGHSGTLPHIKPTETVGLFGAGGRTRTPDLLITNQLLYQLS